MYTTWIVNIGNELLIGKTVNTNGAWLARKLTLLGYDVRRIIVVPDAEDEVISVIKDALNRKIKLVITTGGLGPTFDDRTSEFLAKVLNQELVINEDAFKMIEKTCKERGIEVNEKIIKQAKMPKNAKPIPNVYGTAPGIWIEHENTIIIALPGVPKEMIAMFEQYVEPKLKEIGPKLHFVEKILEIKGVMESEIAHIVEQGLKLGKVYIKSHPKGYKEIEIHVYSSDKIREKAIEEVEKVVKYLINEISKKGGNIVEVM